MTIEWKLGGIYRVLRRVNHVYLLTHLIEGKSDKRMFVQTPVVHKDEDEFSDCVSSGSY